MATIPQWAKEQRLKGTEIKAIGGKYYLCKVSSKWDPELKRAKKISGEYLGALTPDGLIPVQRKLIDVTEPIISKEFGASWLLASLTSDIREKLQLRFPDYWKELYTICLLRTIRPCSFRYIAERYSTSSISEIWPDLALSGSSITSLLKGIGTHRQSISLFMKDFLMGEREYLIFDGTGLISLSERMQDNQIGYNSKGIYDPQINLLYAFMGGQNGGMPAYYRKFPGSIRDISTFSSLISEMNISDTVVIADKGFGSTSNFNDLDESGLKYIVPLRRNNQMYDRTPLKSADKSGFDGAFQFSDRPIWHYSQNDGQGHVLSVFLDGALRLKEEQDYMRRLFERHEGYSEEGLRARQLEFGTIVLKTNLTETAEKIYHLYKKRMQIEQFFDDYKNLMDFDSSYLQSDAAMEAWLFLNHLSMMMCYRVYDLLRTTDSLKRYSMNGVLQEYLSGIRIEKITGSWRYEVMTKGNRNLLKQIGLSLPEQPILF